MKLRQYQQDALDAIWKAYHDGLRRVLIALPTGTGKTVIFASIPYRFRMRKKLLVLAHRAELLDQAAAKFSVLAPDFKVEVEQAGRRASPDARVVVASVQTLAACQGRRLEMLDPDDFSIIVIDEAHHALAPSYRRVIEHFGFFESQCDKLLVGVTATPKRGDGVGLSRIFERIVYERSLEEMIESGFLARIRAVRVQSSVDLDGIKASHGDLPEAELEAAVNIEARNQAAVWGWREHAPGRQTLAFCAGVRHAQCMSDAFEHAGIPARAVWGDMPAQDRVDVLAQFRNGTVKVVCNMGVLTEGFDEPNISAILLARPTLSPSLLTQMVGRGTRLGVGKSDVVVIDLVDHCVRHSLRTTNDLFDLPGALDVRGLDIQRVATRYRKVAEEHPWIDLSQIRELADLEHVSERADLFRLEAPGAIQGVQGRLAWIVGPSGNEDYVLPLPEGVRIRIKRTILDDWEISLRAERSAPFEVQNTWRDFRNAVSAAELLVAQRWPELIRVMDTRASWRKQPATEKQKQLLERRKIPIGAKLTAGQASWMIAQLGLIKKPSAHQCPNAQWCDMIEPGMIVRSQDGLGYIERILYGGRIIVRFPKDRSLREVREQDIEILPDRPGRTGFVER